MTKTPIRKPVAKKPVAKSTESSMTKIPGVKIARKKLSDYQPDLHNANRGTLRGLAVHEKSIDEFGARRGIVVDKNNRILAGNKTAERLADAGITEVIEIETNGNQLVVVKSTDLDINTERGQRYALYDNRVGQLNLDWDPDEFKALVGQGLDLSTMFDPPELDKIVGFAPNTTPDIGAVKIDEADIAKKKAELEARNQHEKDYLDVICPHCAKEFSLDRKQIHDK